MILAPPLDDGAENATLSWVFAGVIPVILGADGTTAVTEIFPFAGVNE